MTSICIGLFLKPLSWLPGDTRTRYLLCMRRLRSRVQMDGIKMLKVEARQVG